MRHKIDSLPSLIEAKAETNKRLKIVQDLLPELEVFSEAVVLVGSLAYGKNFSVRKESDIDILVLIDRDKINILEKSPIFTKTPEMLEAVALFKEGETDQFSIKQNIIEVEVQLHVWDKEIHYRVEMLDEPESRVYKAGRFKNQIVTGGLNFSGETFEVAADLVERYEYGSVYNYPAFIERENCFIMREPISNLISDPDILYDKNNQMKHNIEKIWESLGKRLLEESDFKYEPKKRNIVNGLFGSWNLSPESLRKLEKTQEETLDKLIK